MANPFYLPEPIANTPGVMYKDTPMDTVSARARAAVPNPPLISYRMVPEVVPFSAPEMPQQAAPQMNPWDSYLMQNERALGRPLTPVDYDNLAARFKSEYLGVKMAEEKLTEDQAAKVVEGFDSYASRRKTEAFGNQVVAQQEQEASKNGGGSDPNDPSLLTEFGANVVGGVAKIVPGVLNLADLSARYMPFGALGTVHRLQGKGKNDRTILGDWGQAVDDYIDNKIIAPNTSAASKKAQQEVDAAEGVGDTLAAYLNNKRLLVGIGGQAVGFMIPGVGVSGKVAQGANALAKVGRAANIAGKADLATKTAGVLGRYGLSGSGRAVTASAPSGIAAATNAAADIDAKIANASLEDLIGNSEANKALYDSFAVAGDSVMQERMFRNALRDRAVGATLGTSLAANVGLAGIPGLGAVESRMASAFNPTARKIIGAEAGAVPGVIRNATKRAVVGGAEEAVEEGAAGGIEQLGQNYSLGRPLDEGLAKGVTAGAIAGLGAGAGMAGVSGAVEGQRAKASLKRKPKPAAGSTERPTDGGPGAPATGAAPQADAAPSPARTLYADLPDAPLAEEPYTKAKEEFVTKLEQAEGRISNAVKKSDGSLNSVIATAENQAKKLFGDVWDSLDAEQRVDAVTVVAQLAASKTKHSKEDVGKAILDYRNTVLNPAAAETVTEAPLTEEEAAQAVAQEADPDAQWRAPQEGQAATQETAPDAQQPEAPTDNAPQTKTSLKKGRQPKVATQKAEVAPTTPEQRQEAQTYRTKLEKEFSLQPDELSKIGAPNFKAEYEKRVKDAASKKAKEKADADARAKGLKKQQKDGTNIANHYLAYLANKTDLIPDAARDVIAKDDRLPLLQAAFKAGKVNSTDDVKRVLEEAEAALEKQSPRPKKEDNQLVTKVAGNRAVKNSHPAKVEAKALLAKLKDIAKPEELAKMTLAQARELAAKQTPAAPEAPKPRSGRAPAQKTGVGAKSLAKSEENKAAQEESARKEAEKKAKEDKAKAEQERKTAKTSGERKVVDIAKDKSIPNSNPVKKEAKQLTELLETMGEKTNVSLDEARAKAKQTKNKLQDEQREAGQAKKNKNVGKKKVVKGETPDPKTDAPAEGAAQTSEALKNKAKTVRESLSDILGDTELAPADMEDLVQFVEIAQMGEGRAELSALLKDIGDDLTPAQRTAIGKLSQQEYKNKKKVNDELVKQLADENLDDPDLARIVDIEALRVDEYFEYEKLDASKTKIAHPWTNRAADLLNAIRAGTATAKEAIENRKDALELQDKKSLTAKGIEGIRSRLLKEKEQASSTSMRRAADFALWLLDTNPNLFKDLTVKFLFDDSLKASGAYNPIKDLVGINAADHSVETIVHEILHRAERFMPPALQARIRGEYAGRLDNKLKQQQRLEERAKDDGAKEQARKNIAYLENVVAYLNTGDSQYYQNARGMILSGEVDAVEYYKYLNPSEYWAESGSDILARRNKNGEGWYNELREWFTEFVEKVKDLLGLDNEAAVYKGLREILASDGIRKSDTMLKEGAVELQSIRQGEAEQDDTLDTEEQATAKLNSWKSDVRKVLGDWGKGFHSFVEQAANAALALEDAYVDILKAKGSLPEGMLDPMKAFRLYNGETSRFTGEDNHDYFVPVQEWINENWGKFDFATDSEFLNGLNDFFGYTNLMERIRSEWLTEVPLSEGMEIDREEILEGMEAGEISPTEARRKLTQLVEKYASKGVKEYALKEGGIRAARLDAIESRLKELDGKGVNEKSMAELNALLDGVRKQTRTRLQQAGLVSEQDPWVDFYGWKWYVPLKGVSQANTTPTAMNTFDLIPEKRIAAGKINQQLEAMQGRSDVGERPFERLLVDMTRAGERAANKNFLQTLYETILENPTVFGKRGKPDITVYKGTPKSGYTLNGKPAALPSPSDGFVLHDGDTHYVVRLPHDSNMLRGLLMSQMVRRPGIVARGVSRLTNLMARGYTTAAPTWQTATGFMRELSTLPITIGVELYDNPLDAAKFGAKFFKTLTTNVDAAKTFFPLLLDAKDNIRELAKDEGSYPYWMEQYLANGGDNSFVQGFDLGGAKNQLTGTLKGKVGRAANLNGLESLGAAKDVITIPLDTWLKYSGNYAQFLEMIPRVAAFQTLVEDGMSKQEAAIRVRQTMDYAQSGIWGRSINSYFAFFRVGMTGVDVLRRAFRNFDPNSKRLGKTDWTKVAKYAIPASIVSAAAYAFTAALMGDDDDGEPNIKKIRLSTLTQKVLIPNGTDKPYAINLGLGLPQLLTAPGVILAAVGMGHKTAEEGRLELLELVQRNGPARIQGLRDTTPTDMVGALTMSMTPTIALPAVSVSRNIDSFGRDIHRKIESDKEYKWQQGRASTDDYFIDVARKVHELTGWDMFPEDAKYLMQNYLGQNASDFFKYTKDKNAQAELGIDTGYNPLLSRFTVADADYYAQEDMYDTLDKANEYMKKVKAHGYVESNYGRDKARRKEAEREYLRDNADVAKLERAIRNLDKVKDKRSEKLKAMRGDTLTSDGRKAMIRKELDSDMRKATQELKDMLEEM